MALEADREALMGAGAATAAAAPPVEVDPRPLAPPPMPAAARAPAPVPAASTGPALFANAPDAADLIGMREAVRPLAELCLSPQAQTPFVAGVFGGPGSGKSFALRSLAASVEDLAAASAKAPGSALLSKVVVARVDAAGLSGDPGPAIAAAAFSALELGTGGASYAALADEAAHAATDPLRAAGAAAERHDDISRRLESERASRDEIDARRARIAEVLLYETPGSRIDTMVRASRGAIDAKLRGFGLADGDTGANFRDLVRDASSLGGASRTMLGPRAMWAFRGQVKLLLTAAVALLLSFALGRLQTASADASLRSMGEMGVSSADWIGAHRDWLDMASGALILLAVVAILVNVWRAFSFTSLLFRGLRLLNMDIRERRRELDASLARVERRIAALTTEAEAASKRAETLAQRAGGKASVMRAPGPVFLQALETPSRAARQFFSELGRLVAGPDSPDLPAPQRILILIDNLEALPAAEAARIVDTAGALLSRGAAMAIACDIDKIGAVRERFDVLFDAGSVVETERERLAARLLSGAPSPAPLKPADALKSTIGEPLSQSEIAHLTALAPLTSGTPQALKRLLNAYRLARTEKAPRPAIALALAALSNPSATEPLRRAYFAGGERVEDPSGPPELVAALQATRAAMDGTLSSADAAAAWKAARRYAAPA